MCVGTEGKSRDQPGRHYTDPSEGGRRPRTGRKANKWGAAGFLISFEELLLMDQCVKERRVFMSLSSLTRSTLSEWLGQWLKQVSTKSSIFNKSKVISLFTSKWDIDQIICRIPYFGNACQSHWNKFGSHQHIDSI